MTWRMKVVLLEISMSVLALKYWNVSSLEKKSQTGKLPEVVMSTPCFSHVTWMQHYRKEETEQCSSGLPNPVLSLWWWGGWNGTDAFSMQLIFFFVFCLHPFKSQIWRFFKAQKPFQVTRKILFFIFFLFSLHHSLTFFSPNWLKKLFCSSGETCTSSPKAVFVTP